MAVIRVGGGRISVLYVTVQARLSVGPFADFSVTFIIL